MEAEAKQAPMAPAGLLFPGPSLSLLRLRRPILKSIAQAQAKYEEVEKGTKSWLAAQPLAIEATVCGASAAFQSAVVALSVSYVAGDHLRLPDLSSLPLLKPLKIQSQVNSSLSLPLCVCVLLRAWRRGGRLTCGTRTHN